MGFAWARAGGSPLGIALYDCAAVGGHIPDFRHWRSAIGKFRDTLHPGASDALFLRRGACRRCLGRGVRGLGRGFGSNDRWQRLVALLGCARGCICPGIGCGFRGGLEQEGRRASDHVRRAGRIGRGDPRNHGLPVDLLRASVRVRLRRPAQPVFMDGARISAGYWHRHNFPVDRQRRSALSPAHDVAWHRRRQSRFAGSYGRA